MLTKFSLYDFIAVVIPGVFFMWAAQVLVPFVSNDSLKFSGGIAETSVLIVVGYIAGLLLQGVSQQVTETALLWWWGGFPSARWLLPEENRLTPEYKQDLSNVISKTFGIRLDFDPVTKGNEKVRLKRNQEIFYRCYRAVEKKSELPQIFNAQYGLFRCLFTIFILLSGLLVAQLSMAVVKQGTVSPQRIAVLGLLGISTVISYWRTKKRADDFAKSIFDVFLANFGSISQ